MAEFRYQRLLEIKDILLRLRSVKLREKQDEHAQLNRQHVHSQQIKAKHLEESATSSATREVRLHQLQLNTWYTEQLNDDLREQIRRVRQAEERVEAQRKVVEQSAREKMSLERLKLHIEEEERLESERQLQKMIDEVAARQYIRQMKRGNP